MNSRILAFFTSVCVGAVALAGCGSNVAHDEEVTDAPKVVFRDLAGNPSQPPRPIEKPTLDASSGTIRAAVRQAGAPWEGEPLLEDSNYSSSLDLRRENLNFRDGSLTTDSRSNGQVAIVFVRSGRGDRCGSAVPLQNAYSRMREALDLPDLTSSEIDTLKEGWATGGFSEVQKPGVLLRSSGGCVKGLVVKATA